MDLSALVVSAQQIVASFLALLPRLLLAVLLMTIAWAVARGVRSAIRRVANRHGEARTLELAIGRIAQAGILLVGILVAATAAFPGFTTADLVSTLGIGGVAIGFAFKDIFQNFLAGVLILITKPFRVGDQIVFGDYEGTVEDIQTRATYLKSYDGRRIIIPNGELYTNSVRVNTAFESRRVEYEIGIGYGDDIEQAREILLRILRETDGVRPDPKADVIVTALADASVMLRARWWSSSRQVDVLVARDKVLTRVKRDFQAAGIDLPFPTQQILFHDQTEETDGDRTRQREGWPAGGRPVPRPLGTARAMLERAAGGAERPPA